MKEGWEYKKLGEVCDIINGKNQKAVEDPDGKYPIMGSGGVMGYANNYLCKEGTTIIGRKGTINKPLYVNCKFWNVDTAFGLQPKEETNNKFLYYLCKSINFEQYNKSVTIPSLVKSDLLKIGVHIPNNKIQESVVSELDLLSGVVEKHKAQLEELDKLAQSIFYDMFGDPVTNEKGWTIYKWKDVLLIYNGRNQSQVEDPNGIYPICGSGGVMGYANDYICPDNSIILGRKGNINNPIYMTQKFWNVDTAFGLSPKESLDSFYLYFFCKIFNFEQLKVAVTIPSLRKNDLLNIPIPLPPLSLQQEFAAKVEAIEAMKAKVRQSLKEAETLFNERMDYYFN